MTQPPTVIFNYQVWVARYPEFTGVSEPLAQAYFDEAGLYFANCGWTVALSIAPVLLNMLTAHIAQLNAPLGGQPSPQVVGRVASASEGSVNVSLEYNGSGSPSEAWFTQTKYGAAFWQATAQFRTARYAARPLIINNRGEGRGPYPWNQSNGYPPYGWGGGR